MKPKMRRHLPGKFLARQLAEGAWLLTRGAAAPADIFLRGADSRMAGVLQSSDLADIDIEWHDAAVELTVTAAGRRTAVAARSAIVHEPLAQLYQALPLAVLDGKARRFWRRVFWLVRIPGGRRLLGAMARRTRSRH
jgi:hypothetical protein